jgi:hypothetical protein
MTEKDEWNRDAVSWLEGSPAKEGGSLQRQEQLGDLFLYVG